MSECDNHPDHIGGVCPDCGEEVDNHGNTESRFEHCSFPDCGCDGARLCMAGEANDYAASHNVEGMHRDPSKKAARLNFALAETQRKRDQAEGGAV